MHKRRVFFALWPSAEQREAIALAIEPYRARLKGKWVARDNWHVTLVFIGNFPERDLPALQAAASDVPRPDIALAFDRLEFWKRPRIVCLEADVVPGTLTNLVQSLETASAPLGYRPEKRPYRAHLTLARNGRYFEPIRLAQAIDLSWSGFELLESVSTSSGVEYRPLKQ